VLYASDLTAARLFYGDVVGVREIERPNEHSLAFRLDDGGLLLVFDPEQSSAEGRFVPAHGTTGAGHMAFRVEALDEVSVRLRERGIEIEREITWPRGGRSVYVRDPAGNSVEFVEGEIWGD
jgi:catechol 2,3-dioxygenase-like lactoylglutathione lyase family enzyme